MLKQLWLRILVAGTIWLILLAIMWAVGII